MRGDYHHRLRDLLQAAIDRKNGTTQDSLAKAIQKEQTSVGKILKDKGGTLDLDEADAALRHIGSTLPEFIASVPPRPLTEAERVAHALAVQPELLRVVTALLDVPRTRLPAVSELIHGLLLPAIGRRGSKTGELTSGPMKARRTTKGRAQHR